MLTSLVFLDPNRFDLILCLGVVQYLDSLELLLACVRRNLAPDGVLIVSWPNERSWFRWVHYLLFPRSRGNADFRSEEFVGMMSEQGLELLTFEGHSCAFPWVPDPMARLNLWLERGLSAFRSTPLKSWIEEHLAFSHIAAFRWRV